MAAAPSSGLRLAEVQSKGPSGDGREAQGASDGQKRQRLNRQKEKSMRRSRLDLDPCLDQQGEQQQHRGLESQHLGGAQWAKRVQKHGGSLGVPILPARRRAGSSRFRRRAPLLEMGLDGLIDEEKHAYTTRDQREHHWDAVKDRECPSRCVEVLRLSC